MLVWATVRRPTTGRVVRATGLGKPELGFYKTIVDRQQHGATRDFEAEKSGTQPNAWFLIELLI
jgi:hypothetical protein